MASRPLPLAPRETETEGAFRALGVLRWLALRAGREPGPRSRELERAVASALAGEDSHDHYLACRLGAAVEQLVVTPMFNGFLCEMAAHDVAGDEDEFGHDEVVAHVAAQLRAVGTPLIPVARDPSGQTPDLEHEVVDVEVKHRPLLFPNEPCDIESFVSEAMKAPQLRKRRAGILVLDLGRYELPTYEIDFANIIGVIERRLRASKRIHAVILLALKRRVDEENAGPGSWLYICADDGTLTKEQAMPPAVRQSLSAFVAAAEEVLPHGRRRIALG